MFNEDFKNSVSIKLEDVEILPLPFRENIEREMEVKKGYKIIQFAVTIDGYVILYEDSE